MANEVITVDDKSWVTDLLDKLTSIVEHKGGILKWTDPDTGESLQTIITHDLVQVLIANKTSLAEVGLNTFKQFLALIHKQQSFDALVAVYSKLDNAALIAQFQTDSAKLAEIAANTQAARKFWADLGKQLALKLLSAGVGALL